MIFKKTWLLIFILGFSSSLLAAPQPSHLEIGLGTYLFDYNESVTPPLRSFEHGQVPYLECRWTGPWTATLQGGMGKIAYNSSAPSDLVLAALSVEKEEQTWFWGGSLKYWRRNVSNQYIENYGWISVFVGPHWDIQVIKNLNLGIKAGLEYMPIAFMHFESENVVFGMHGGIGYRVECPLTLTLNADQSVSITPWIHFYSFNASDVQNLSGVPSYEPSSTTQVYGLTGRMSL